MQYKISTERKQKMDMDGTGLKTHTHMIDLVLEERRWNLSIRYCRTYQGADISSDHSLVMCKLQLLLKKSHEKSATTPQIDIEALNRPEIHQAHTEELDRRLEQIGVITLDMDERVASKQNTIIHETMKAIILARKDSIRPGSQMRQSENRDGKNQEAIKAKTTGIK